MRYLILSDIHANWDALDAVLADASGEYDRILNCGDLVGYGPDPDRVVEFCRDHCNLVIRGNHDKAIAGLADMDWFNPVARAAAVWSQSVMKPDNVQYLRNLPQGPAEVEQFSLLHGAPFDEDEYVISAGEAREAAETAITGLSFFGHTHVQGGFLVNRTGVAPIRASEIQIGETATYLINPGSVGQPRDGDPRAAYALYDSDAHIVFQRRIAYSIDLVQKRINDAGLPPVLGLRLVRGL